MTTGDLKKLAIETLQVLLARHQDRREQVTLEGARKFMMPRRLSLYH